MCVYLFIYIYIHTHTPIDNRCICIRAECYITVLDRPVSCHAASPMDRAVSRVGCVRSTE